jgi:DNA invertase Pin-like site-specific DNA recombinase
LFKDPVIAILAVMAKQERIRRSERPAAAVARLHRERKTGQLGRKRTLDRAKLEAVRHFHSEGMGLRPICGHASRFADDGAARREQSTVKITKRETSWTRICLKCCSTKMKVHPSISSEISTR